VDRALRSERHPQGPAPTGYGHTCVSLLLERGAHPRTVMEIVGHSATEMTMKVYGHVNLAAQRKVMDQLDSELS
jgi:integrase